RVHGQGLASGVHVVPMRAAFSAPFPGLLFSSLFLSDKKKGGTCTTCTPRPNLRRASPFLGDRPRGAPFTDRHLVHMAPGPSPRDSSGDGPGLWTMRSRCPLLLREGLVTSIPARRRSGS